MDEERCDVAVIGGGPAGISAALTLARANRKVVVFDEGLPRNATHARIRGLFGFDGSSRVATCIKARKQLGVSPETLRRGEADGKIRVERTPGGHRR